MAEGTGLAVGAIGLAGLFGTCVDCFKLVQVYGARSRDYETLQTMLDNQQFHFMAWGRACGFMDPDGRKYTFDGSSSADINKQIRQTMERIIALFMDSESLRRKYGLKAQQGTTQFAAVEGPPVSAFSKVFQTTKDFWNTSLQRKTQIVGTNRWAVSDRDKFEALIKNLRDLISDLKELTETTAVPQFQQVITKYELEMIDDQSSLEIITASADNEDDDILSTVAGHRLARVKAQSIANRSIKFDDSASMASFASHASSMSTFNDENMAGAAQEIGVMRVHISEWRNVKTHAGIISWLKTIVVATGSLHNMSELTDDMQPLSRVNTPDETGLTTNTKPSRVAINSPSLINSLRKVTKYRFSSRHNVLVHPFKPLIVYENELRQYTSNLHENLRRLEKRHCEEPAEADDSSEPACGTESKIQENRALDIEKTRRAIQELECLLEFMDNDLTELLHIRKQLHAQSLQKISFENLWLLFRPGTIAISPDPTSDDNDTAYQILHVTGGRRILDLDNNSRSEELDNAGEFIHNSQHGYAVMSSQECTDFVIDCFYMDFDGTSYGPRSQRFVISEYSAERDALSLPLYPIGLSSSPTEMRRKLLDRGERFLECTRKGWYSYYNKALNEWDPHHRDECTVCARDSAKQQINSEVIIDHTMAIVHCRNSKCIWNPSFGGSVIARATKANYREAFETVDCANRNCKSCTDIFNDAVIDLKLRDKFLRNSQNLKAVHQEQLGEDQLLLLPYRICGYSLYHRKWFPLNVSQLQEVQRPINPFDRLVLPSRHERLLVAITEGHVQNARQREYENMDAVHGRGSSLLILLYGAPGTGKASAAGAVATRLGKPLLPIRITDIGSVTKEDEQNLNHFVTLAERWRCILLMRGADNVLAQRAESNREGTNITSMFIDALKDFSGIVIFTTNRVDALDAAFKSRVHFALKFLGLGIEDASIASEKLLRHLTRVSEIRCSDDAVEYFRDRFRYDRIKCNGHEIETIITSAIALARMDAKALQNGELVLKQEHVKTALANVRALLPSFGTRGGERSIEASR